MCTKINPAFSEKVVMKVNRLDFLKPHIEYCAGESQMLDLSVQSTPSNNYNITWKNGSSTLSTANSDQMNITNANSGFVDFTINYGVGCVKHDTVNITVNPLPIASVSVDKDTIRYGRAVQLDATVQNPTNEHVWSPLTVSDPSKLNPTAVITEPTLFSLLVTDQKGCTTTKSVMVNLVDECNPDYIYAPNAFTPNRDGINDCFGLLDPTVSTDFHMAIFNRWGERMYETYDVTQCWDGTYKGVDALMDTYSFIISYRCYNGVYVEKHGILVLFR
jgi:gliding motility-associated-like protein